MKKEPRIFIKHILENIEKIELFSKNLSKQELYNNKLKQYAIIRAIEIIGETSKNLSENLKSKYLNIPWKEIIGTRDMFIHQYFGVDLDIVWDIIKNDLPTLKKQILEIKKDLEKK